jgi:uncharacterized protein (DUF433 family)
MPNVTPHIISDPTICGGQPTNRGPRMRVSDVIDLITAGESREVILEDYPYLKDGDITAALDLAKQESSKLSELFGQCEWISDYDHKKGRER